MNNQALKSKYRLLVLMDNFKASHNALKNAINLAKLIDGCIEVFQVQKITSEVSYGNQISFMGAIHEECSKQKEEFRNIVNLLAKKEGLPVTCNFTFGNVKNEIDKHIKKTNPDIVVIGKRKKKIVNFLGDGITKGLLEDHDGAVLISGDNEAFTSYYRKSIGFLNNVEGIEKITLLNDLKKYNREPHKLFKINQNDLKRKNDESAKLVEQQTKKETIVYEFEASANTASGMANLISNNNLALLCLNKKNKNRGSFSNGLNEIFTKTIEQTSIPVLVLNN